MNQNNDLTPSELQLGIIPSHVQGNTICRCGAKLERRVPFEIGFVSSAWRLLCIECGRKHAPTLASMLDDFYAERATA